MFYEFKKFSSYYGCSIGVTTYWILLFGRTFTLTTDYNPWFFGFVKRRFCYITILGHKPVWWDRTDIGQKPTI